MTVPNIIDFHDSIRQHFILAVTPPILGLTALKPPKPTFLYGPYKSHISVYNKNLQKSRVMVV